MVEAGGSSFQWQLFPVLKGRGSGISGSGGPGARGGKYQPGRRTFKGLKRSTMDSEVTIGVLGPRQLRTSFRLR